MIIQNGKMKIFFIIIYTFILLGCSNTPGAKNELIKSPINLSHALSLIDSMVVEDEMIAYIWIYSDAPDYVPIAASQEGITCVDDVGRFLEIIEHEHIMCDCGLIFWSRFSNLVWATNG